METRQLCRHRNFAQKDDSSDDASRSEEYLDGVPSRKAASAMLTVTLQVCADSLIRAGYPSRGALVGPTGLPCCLLLHTRTVLLLNIRARPHGEVDA